MVVGFNRVRYPHVVHTKPVLTSYSLERHHGLDHSAVSRVHGLETSNETEHEVGAELLDVWRNLVSLHTTCFT